MAAAVHELLTKDQAFTLSSHPGRAGANRSGLTASLGRLLQRWHTRSREREIFALFDHRDLRDIGVSRWDLERELSKPFWRG